MVNRPPERPHTAWCYYVRVDDVRQTADKVRQHGGRIASGPKALADCGSMAQCHDPSGGMFALHQTAR
jgi:predicted enzyme related to lactoylglutathione lyase